jgi:hypothetical protein
VDGFLERAHGNGLKVSRTERKQQRLEAPIRWGPSLFAAHGSGISLGEEAVSMRIAVKSASRRPQSAFLIASRTRNQGLAILKKEQMDTQMSGTYKAKNIMSSIFLA